VKNDLVFLVRQGVDLKSERALRVVLHVELPTPAFCRIGSSVKPAQTLSMSFQILDDMCQSSCQCTRSVPPPHCLGSCPCFASSCNAEMERVQRARSRYPARGHHRWPTVVPDLCNMTFGKWNRATCPTQLAPLSISITGSPLSYPQ
jgi:hypothetical protein